MLQGCFITATGTDAGKTHISLAIIAALQQRGTDVCAVKPLETGCDPNPADALRLAEACKRPALAHAPGLYRGQQPLSPAACQLLEAEPGPGPGQSVTTPEALATRCLALPRPHDYVLIEGAGGLLVPIDDSHSVADVALELAKHMHLAVIIVAPDRLGTLSDTLCTYEAAKSRKLPVAAVVLNSQEDPPSHPKHATRQDMGPASNSALLSARLPVPVLRFPHCFPEPDALAIAAEQAGLAPLLAPLL